MSVPGIDDRDDELIGHVPQVCWASTAETARSTTPRHVLEVIFVLTGIGFATSVTSGSVGAVIGKWLKKANIPDRLDPPTPIRNPQDRML